jgi:hypothetical protein
MAAKRKRKKTKRSKFFVGLTKTDKRRVVFKSAEAPTEASHGHKFGAVVGPYRSKREAEDKLHLM